MLRWRLFGINFCITPDFWFMNALWALLIGGALTGHQLQDRLLLIFIAVWVLCTLVSVMVHELGHVIVARIFGQPGNITVSGLGGQAVGNYDALRPWQRILVILAGPSAGFAFVALIVCFDGAPWNDFMGWLTETTGSMFFIDHFQVRLNWVNSTPLASLRIGRSFAYMAALSVLTFMNLFVNIMNLFPIIPMDGGMIMKEFACLASPRYGLKIAFGISFVLALAATVFYLDLTLERYEFLPKRLQPYYPFGFPEFSLIVFAMLAYRAFQTYRQLTIMERHRLYMEDEDMSGPRALPAGVTEVPVKDPEDFAPRAPGSERPR